MFVSWLLVISFGFSKRPWRSDVQRLYEVRNSQIFLTFRFSFAIIIIVMGLWISKRLREEFLGFFTKKGHKVFPSSSLSNSGDPSVLLTTAGMQQFKPFYVDVSRADREIKTRKTASSQKCFRTTDIDEVGDATHNTFFEMLGNFSFGDYFKEEAITLAFELLTKVYGLDTKRFVVTVFTGDKSVPRDEESVKVWGKLGFSENKGNLRFAGREDNFWGPTGDEGPCGPTTEIYVDGVEIWNIVFNEYYGKRGENGELSLEKLKHHGVDTGMGLERLARVMQKVPSIFESDLFSPLMKVIEKKAEPHLPKEVKLKAGRVVADHMRGGAFLMAEGLEPSNVKAGYVLRRVLRRAIRFAHTLHLPYETFANLVETTGRIYQEVYPELLKKKANILQIFEKEYQAFGKTLKKGITIFEKAVSKNQKKSFSGKEAFFLYATYGFPLELIEEMLKERELTLERKSFEIALNEHKALSKKQP